jgi:hypothetical protein
MKTYWGVFYRSTFSSPLRQSEATLLNTKINEMLCAIIGGNFWTSWAGNELRGKWIYVHLCCVELQREGSLMPYIHDTSNLACPLAIALSPASLDLLFQSFLLLLAFVPAVINY